MGTRKVRTRADPGLRRGGGEIHWREAAEAYRRFGKGRHAAALNFGDCLSYAVASLAGEPLLFVGEDFAADRHYQVVAPWLRRGSNNARTVSIVIYKVEY